MAQIKIKTPLTSDGLQVILGPDGKVQYREDYADARARKDFERANTKLPNNLKMIIEDVVTEQPKVVEQPKEEVKLEETIVENQFSQAIKKSGGKKSTTKTAVTNE